MHLVFVFVATRVGLKKDEIDRNNPREWQAKEAYNFYLSQLRIRVEMAFGMLVNKWWIFKSPLMHNTAKASAIIQCAMRLHNLCIAARLKLHGTSDIDAAADDSESPECPAFVPNSDYLEYLPSQTTILPPTQGTAINTSSNIMRREILGFIRELHFLVPEHNRKRHWIQRQNDRDDGDDEEADEESS
jgi:DDE superfamily endonuclease